MSAPFTFVLPPGLSAKEPPERRGIRRDQVRLMVIDRATRKTEHTRFDKIDNYLRPGDLLVFNSSRTLPASMRGCECSESHGPCMEVRLAERLPDELTGLHKPQASRLDLLSAFLPSEQICAAYEEALARKYLWHEFGDLNLIL
jgi:S-adenosylmethionine:tRNA-ribosyltransferase-isomerase (queuine synthetase)